MGSVAHLHIQRQLVLAGMCVHLPGHRVPPDLRALLPTEWHDASLEIPLLHYTHPDLAQWRSRIQYTGHVDAVLRMNDGRLAVFDLKTVASKYADPSYRYHAEKTAHYPPQVNSYMALFAMPDGEQARAAYVLLLDRDDPAHRLMYQLDYDADAWDADRTRLEAAHDAVGRKELPDPEPGRGCRFCSYKKICEGYRR